MGHRCCSKQKVKRGLWSPEEDERLVKYITAHGHSSWSSVPKLAGLQRCGKSCRLRWINYLRPDLKRGTFTAQEEQIIIDVHRILGNRWAQIAKHLPGRTDNEVKNFWNSCIKKKLMAQGLDPRTHNLIPARLRSHHHHLCLTTAAKSHSINNVGHHDDDININGENQLQVPFSMIITVSNDTTNSNNYISPPPITHTMNMTSDPPPGPGFHHLTASSIPHDHHQYANCNMLLTTSLEASSWAPVEDVSAESSSSPTGFGLLVDHGNCMLSSAPPTDATTITQLQVGDPSSYYAGPYNNYMEEVQAGAMAGSGIIGVVEEEEGYGGRGFLNEGDHQMIGIGRPSFDCSDFDHLVVDPTMLSSSICRDLHLTSMDLLLPWNF